MEIVEVIKKNTCKVAFRNATVVIEIDKTIERFDITIFSMWESLIGASKS